MYKQENNYETHEGAGLFDGGGTGGPGTQCRSPAELQGGTGTAAAARSPGAQLDCGQCRRGSCGEDAASPGLEGFNFSLGDLRPRGRNTHQE